MYMYISIRQLAIVEDLFYIFSFDKRQNKFPEQTRIRSRRSTTVLLRKNYTPLFVMSDKKKIQNFCLKFEIIILHGITSVHLKKMYNFLVVRDLFDIT